MIHRFVIRNRHRNEYAGASKGTRLPASHHGVVRMVQNLGSTAPGTLGTRGSWLHATVAVCTVFFLSYFVAMLGGVLVLRPQMVWPLWPGCAFLVAVLLVTEQKLIWPALLIAGLAGFAFYDFGVGLRMRTTLLFLLADAVEILVAAFGVSWAFGGKPRLNSVKALAKYSSFAIVLAPVSVASLGASAIGGGYRLGWKVGFLTEALALLTLTPAILSWIDIARSRLHKPWTRYAEAALMLSGLGIVAHFAFVTFGGNNRPALLYALVPFLLWSALRLGIAGISNSMLVVCLFAIWGETHTEGIFQGDSPLGGVLDLQVFLLFATASFMVLAAVVEERKDDEQQLRESEQRFRLVADSAPVLIWMSDTDNGCTYVNKSWLDFTGRPLEKELGNGWAESIHSEDLQACLRTYAQSFDRREKFEIEYRARRHDGEYRWILDMGVPRFNRESSFAGYIGVAVDVTERKNAEIALLGMNRKLIEAQEQERARIGRELHDDVTQRLALIAIELQQLQHTPSSIPDRVQDLVKQTTELSADVQALSHELHSSKLEYLGVVAGIRSWCNEFSERQRMEVDFRSDVHTPLPSDIGLCLFRVLQEAMHNAVKHSGVKRVEVKIAEYSNEVQLAIHDSGKGFDVEAARQGNGLGLTSMQERVRLLNGTIAFASQPSGGGTSIRVS